MNTWLQAFPTTEHLLTLPAEDLAAVLMDILPSAAQNGVFEMGSIKEIFFNQNSQGYSAEKIIPVMRAFHEALQWLINWGLVIKDPAHNTGWYVVTRLGQQIKNREDLASYKKGHNLPSEILQPILNEKVRPLFLRGDYDVAVFQAMKLVEAAVRKAAGFPNSVMGTDLMRKALNVETGPLTDQSLGKSEREAEANLFSGAIGHAKNPTSHREVVMSPETAVRMILLASYLLDIVESRKLIN